MKATVVGDEQHKKVSAEAEIEESYRRLEELNQQKCDFQRAYLDRCERQRQEMMELQNRELLLEHQGFHNKSKMQWGNLTFKAKQAVEDVNKGVARMKHNYGVDYPVPEMHKDKDLDWTGLDLNISGIMKENIPPPYLGPVNPSYYTGPVNFMRPSVVERVDGGQDRPVNCRDGSPTFVNKPTQEAHPRYSTSRKEEGRFHRRGVGRGRSAHDNGRQRKRLPDTPVTKFDPNTSWEGSLPHSRSDCESVVVEPSRSKSGHTSRVSSTPVSMGTKMQIPKMSFSGEYWRGFVTQFEAVAEKCGWTEGDKLEAFPMVLKKEALEYYSILPSEKTKNFSWLKAKFEHNFNKVEPPTTVRWVLLSAEQREDETLEKYLARLEKMVLDVYPSVQEQEFNNSMFVEVFLKGCRDKGAVLAVCDKHPKNLEEAYTLVKSASTYRKTILGKKGGSSVRKLQMMVETSSGSDSSEAYNDNYTRRHQVRSMQLKEGSGKQMSQMDRLHSVESDLKTVKDSLAQVLNILTTTNSSPKPKGLAFFECGDLSHLVRDCPRRRSQSPKRSPSRSDNRNWRTGMGSGEGADLRPSYQKNNSGGRFYSPQLKVGTDSPSGIQRASSPTGGKFNSLNK